MHRFTYILFVLCLFISSVCGQSLTQVTDTIIWPNGTQPSGTITLSWQRFLNASHQVVAPGNTVVPVTNGFFSVNLNPTDTAVPPGVCYVASYFLNGTTSLKAWYVPTSATSVNLNTVEFNTRCNIQQSANVAVAQLTNSNASSGQCIVWNGTYWAPGNCGGGGGGGGSFSNITTGVNTNQTLTAGNGTSITYTGTGAINANRILGTTISSLSGNGGILARSSGVLPSGEVAGFDLNGNVVDSGLASVNVIVSSGSYPNPAWITTLASSKLTGTIPGSILPPINLAASGAGGVTGNLPVTNLNGGLGAFPNTFWAGDGTWKALPGSGTVTNTCGPLVAGRLVIGNGGVDACVLASLGTSTTVLHGNAGGSPTFSAVSLTADVSGILPSPNGGTNTAYFAVSGPTALRTYSLPDVSTVILTANSPVTPAQGGTGFDSSGIVKGGLLCGTAAGTYNLLTVGTNGQILTADSTQTCGFKWGTAAAAGTVTSITFNSPLSGGTITTSGTVGCATCVTSAASLTNNQLVLGAGSQASQTLGSLGTTSQVLHGNASGIPSFSSVVNSDIANATIDLTAKVTGILPNANTTATNANTASAIVARDASGNFSAGTITATLSGAATTAGTITGLLALANTPLTTSQDILYDNSGALARLPIVSSGTCLGNSGGVWASLTCSGGGGSPAFSAITSATNTTAVMTVGSGATLNFSGTGTVAANNLGFGLTLVGGNITASTATLLTNSNDISGGCKYIVSSNGTTAYVASTATGCTATTTSNLQVGSQFLLNVDTTCSASCNLDLGPGAISIKQIDGTTDPNGALVSGQPQWISLAASGGTCNPASSLSHCVFVLQRSGRTWFCTSPGLGDGANAIAMNTYLQTNCYNGTGATVTITGVKCYTDNNGTSTLNASGNTLGALLTRAVTCTNAFASGTQSTNILLTPGDFINFTFAADGTSKQSSWVITGTY